MSKMKMARPNAVLFLAVLGIGGAASAQVPDPAVQNQIFMEQQAQQRQILDQQRQAYVQEQQARTQQNLSDLAGARRGEPAPVPSALPPLSSSLAARALTLQRLADEASVRLTRLTVRPRTAPDR